MQIRALHIVTSIASALLLASTAQADTLSKIRTSQTITIANRDASLPFSYLDENKKPIGYSIDLCLKIAEAVKRELKLPKLDIVYLSVTPTTRIPAIIEGKADLECGSTTNNAERRKTVAFTIPHFVAATRMLVRADSGIKNWQDLRDRRIAATKGTTAYKMAQARDQSNTLNFKVIEAADHAESFYKVEKGEADAFAMDDVLLYGLRAKSKNPDFFTIVGDPLSTEPYAIMMRKDDAAFKSLADREMARMIHDGELVKLYDKWFLKPIPPLNINLNMQMGFLLRESLRFPTDKVADQ